MKFQLAAFADEADSRLVNQITAMTENGISYLEIRGVDGENIADISAQKARKTAPTALSERFLPVFTGYTAFRLPRPR